MDKERCIEILRWREQKKLEVLSFLSDPFRQKLDKADMVVRLSEEKYKLSDDLYLKFGIENEYLEGLAEYYGLLKSDND